MYYIYGISGPSVLIESTDSLIKSSHTNKKITIDHTLQADTVVTVKASQKLPAFVNYYTYVSHSFW